MGPTGDLLCHAYWEYKWGPYAKKTAVRKMILNYPRTTVESYICSKG